jgi:cell wall-associated NlpC family hydrolase
MRHRIYRGRTVYHAQLPYTPLQPFSLDAVRPAGTARLNAAYYAPHAIPRASQPDGDDEESSPMPEIRSSGSGPTVAGNRALLRNGVAYAPSNAPDRVKAAIWAVNGIRKKPYHWGGGHGSFSDSGYDCSGTVSFALHYAGALNQPLPSSDLLRFGERGRGRWITVYSRHGHTFATIAGLRLDTTDFRYGGDVGPRWHTDGRDTGGFEARHPAGL